MAVARGARSSSSGRMVPALLLMLVAFAGLGLWSLARPVAELPSNVHAILVTEPSSIPRGLKFHPHCHDHKGEKGYAVLTYELLKTGQCIMTARLCHRDDPDYKLWLCLADPTGFVSGIFVVDNVIIRAGFGTRRKSSWFTKGGPFEDFWICPDGILQ